MIEDLVKNFQFDIGKIEVYCFVGGNGVCFDGGNGFVGVVIIFYYDSMFVKVLCYGLMYEIVCCKVFCVFIEFCICGVKINIFFLVFFLIYLIFIDGNCWMIFIDDILFLFDFVGSQNCVQKFLVYFGDFVVNGSSIKG